MRRRLPARRPSSRWFWWIGGIFVVLGVVLLVALPTLVIGYLQRLVRADEFHATMEQFVEGRVGGEASISPLVWQDDAATMADVSVRTKSGWSVNGAAVRVAVDFGAIRRGAWHIQGASADELTLMKLEAPALGDGDIDNASEVQVPGWIARYVPKSTEVDGLDVERFAFKHGAWQMEGARLHLGSYDSENTGPARFSIPGSLQGGTLRTPLMLLREKAPLLLDVQRAAFRVTDDKVTFSEASLNRRDRGAVALRGSMRFGSGEWQCSLEAKDFPAGDFLTEEWQKHLSGRLEVAAELSGSRDQPVAWTADVALKDGVLTTLPMLDKLAAHTRVDRFKRLVLDVATAKARPHSGGGTRLEKIVVQSNGLLRIEGALTLLPGDAIDGEFMLGVTPETLRWLPGAQNRIFIEKNPEAAPGLHWTRVKVAGTRTAPQEDLSARLLGAAGMSLLLDTPGVLVDKAGQTLVQPILGEDAAKLPGQMIDGATKTLESGVKTGTELLNKVIPVFPAK